MPDPIEATVTAKWLAAQLGVDEAELDDLSAFIGKKQANGEWLQNKAIPGAFRYLRWQRDKITRQQVADYLGVSAARVSQMTRDGLFQQQVDSEYSRHETVQAICRYLRGESESSKAGIGEIRRKKLEQESQILGYALAREQRTMLPVAAVEKAWEHVILLCRQKLSRIGNKVAPRIPYLKAEMEVETAIQAEVDEATAELSRPIEYEEEAAESVKE